MLKNYVIADPSNIANTIATYNHLNSNLVSNPYIPDMPDMFGFDKISNSFIIADIPTIFTITSVETCGPKLVRIKYKVEDPQLNVLSKSGSIYINSGIFGVYDELTNFYWRNEITIEVESEECIDKIQPGMKFTNATQWEKKLTVEEIINMVNNPFEYYKYVHKVVEQYVHDKPRSVCIEKHQEIDKLYGLG